MRSCWFVRLSMFALLVSTLGGGAWGVDYFWTGSAGDGDWSNSNNWTPNSGYPSLAADTANFFSADITGNAVGVTIATPISIAALNIPNPNYQDDFFTLTLGGSGSLTAASMEFYRSSSGDAADTSTVVFSLPVVCSGTMILHSGANVTLDSGYTATIGTIDNVGGATPVGSVSVAGTLSVDTVNLVAGRSLDVASGGNATVSTLLSAAAGSLSVDGGSLTNNGSLTTAASLAVGAGGATLDGGANGLTVTAATYTGSPAVTTSGTLTLPRGTLGALTVSSGSLTFSGGAASVSAASASVGGTLTPNANLTVTGALGGTGTVVVAGSTLSLGSLSGAGSLTVSTTTGTVGVTGTGGTLGTLTVGTSATLTGGATGLMITNPVAGTVTTGGNVTLNGTGLTAVTNSGTLTLNGNLTTSGAVTNTSSLAVGANALSFAGYGGAGGTVSVSGGALTNTGGASIIPTLTLSTSATLTGGAGLTATAATYTGSPAVTTSGTVTLPRGTLGALTVTSGSLTFSGGAASVSASSASVGGTLTPNANLTVGGALGGTGTVALAGGTLSLASLSGAGSLTVSTTSGTVSVTGTGGTLGTLTVTTGVTLAGGATGLVITNPVTANLTTSGLVTLNGTPGTMTNTGSLSLNGDLTASGALSNVGGTVATAAHALSFLTYTGGSGDSVTTSSGSLTATGNGGTIATLTVTTAATLAGGAGTNGIIVTNAVSGNLTTSGKVTLNGAVGALTNSGTLTLNGNLTASGALTNTGTVAASNRALSFASYSGGADVITVTTGTVTATGTGGTIATLTVGTSVTLDGGATGLVVTNAVAGNLTTLGSVTLHGAVGSVSNSGSLTLNGITTLSGNLLSTAGTVDMAGYNLTLGAVQLRGTVVNSGAAAVFTAGNLTLAAHASVTTSGGNAVFGSVTGASAGGQSLTVIAGTGAVSFSGAVGTTALSALTVGSSGTLSLQAVSTTGAQSYTAGTSATLNGNLTTTANPVTFAGATPVLLATGGIQISTAGGAVGFTGTVDGGQVLTLVLGAGTASVSAPVGGLTPLAGLTLTSGTLALGAQPLSVYGPVVLTAGTVSGTGTVTVRGNLSRGTGIVSLTGGTLVLDGTAAAQTANLTGSTVASLTANNTSGTPTVTLNGYPGVWSGNAAVTSGSLVLSANSTLSIAGNLTGAGALNAAAIAGVNSLTLGGSVGTAGTPLGALTAPAGTLSVGGGQFHVSSFTASSGTAVFPASTTVYAANTFQNVTKTTAGTLDFDTGVAFTAIGNLTVSAGAVVLNDVANSVGGNVTGAGALDASAMAGTSLSVGGNWSVSSFSAGTGVLRFNGTAAQAVALGGQSFATLRDSNTSGSVTVTGTGSATGLTVDASTTVVLGGTATAGLTVSGTVSTAVGGALNLSGAAGAVGLTLSGAAATITNSGTLQVSSSANTVTLDGGASTTSLTGNALSLSGGGLTLANFVTAVPHTLTTARTLLLSGTVSLSGLLTLNAAGGAIQTGAATLNATGGITVTAGSFQFSSAGATVNTATAAFTVNGGTVSVAASPTAWTVGDFTVSSGSVAHTAANTLTAAGNVTITVAAANFTTPANSTLVMSGIKNLNAQPPLGNLTLSGTASVSVLTNALSVSGNLTVPAGTTLLTGAPGASVTGTATGGGTLTGAAGNLVFSNTYSIAALTASSGTTSFGGAAVTFSSFGANGGTVRFTRTGAQAWSTGGAVLNALTMNAATTAVTATGSFTVAALSLTTGTLTVASGTTLTLTGAPSLTGGTLSVNGGVSASGVAFTVAGSTVSVANNGAFTVGAMTVSSGSFTQTGDNGANTNGVDSLTVSGGSVAWDSADNGGTLAIAGSLAVSGGTLSFHLKNVTVGTSVSGSVTFRDLIIPNGKTFKPLASAAVTVSRNVDIQTGGVYDSSNVPRPTLTLGGALAEAGTLTDSNGTLSDLGPVTVTNAAKTLATALKVSSLAVSSTVNLNGNNLTVLGSLTGAGTVAASATETLSVGSSFQIGTFTPGTSETVVLSSDTAGAATLNSGYTFHNLTVAKGVGNSVTLPASATTVVSTGLTLTSGTWTAGTTTTLTAAGNWNSSAANFTFAAGSGTVVLTSAAPTVTLKTGDPFNHLTLDAGATLGSTLTVGGNLVIGALGTGVFSDGGYALAVTGTTTATLGANALSVIHAANHFGGVVALSNSGANSLALRDSAAVTFGAVTAGNNLTVTAGGLVTLGGAVSTGGYTSVASAGVTQSGGSLAAAGGLAVTGTGTFTLAQAANATPSLAANVTGNLTFATTTALSLTTVNAVATVTATNLTLTSGALSQTVPVSTGTLVLTSSGSITLNHGSNAVTTLGTVTRGGATQISDNLATLTVTGPLVAGTTASAVTLSNTGALVLTGSITATGANNVSLSGAGYTQGAASAVNAGAGTITVNAGGGSFSFTAGSSLTTTNASATAVVLRNGSGLSVPAVTANSGTLVLGVGTDVTGAVTQTGIVSAAALSASLAGSLTLTTATNAIAGLAAVSTGGAVQITTGSALTVTGAVSTSGSDLTLTTAGFTLPTGGSINVGAASMRLSATSTAQETGTGIITAAGLQLAGAGPFTLNAANAVTTLAAATSGATAVTTSAAAVIGAVTTNAVLTSGVNTGAGSFSLSSAGATQTQGITATGLKIVGTGTFTLNGTTNTLGTLAGNVTGSASLRSTGAVSIGTVAATAGLTVSGNLTLYGSAAWTQTSPIQASGLELLGAAGVFYTLTNGSNAVTTLAASVAGTTLSYSDTDAVVVGTVNTVGLTAASATLTTGGSLTQSVSPAGRITLTSTLTLAAGANTVTLADPTNTWVSVTGTTGPLTLNEADGYTVSGVSASGNVDLATVAGDITVGTGTTLATSGTATQNLHPAARLVVSGQVATTNGQVTFNPGTLVRLDSATVPVVRSTGSGVLLFSRPTEVVQAGANTVTATSGDVTFGASATVNGSGAGRPLTVNAGTGQVTFLASLGGSTTLGALSVTSATSAAGVTFASTTNVGSFTVTNGGAVLVQGAVTSSGTFGSTGTTFNNTGGTITTAGNLAVNHTGAVTIGAALSSGTGTTAVRSTGSSVALGAGISTTSGQVTIDSAAAGGTTILAAGDIVTTLAGGTVSIGSLDTGLLTTAGDITTNGTLVRWYQAATLSASVAVATSGGGYTASGTVGGGGNTLTLNTGAGNSVFTGAVDNLNLVVTQTGDLTASSTWGAVTPRAVTVHAATGTIAFTGTQTNITTLTTDAGAYGLTINSSGTTSTITTSSLAHTGLSTLGTSGGDLLFTNGLNGTSASSTLSQGTIRTSNTPLVLGAVTLAGTTTFSTAASAATADLTLGSVTGAGAVLNLQTGGVAGADATIGPVAGVSTLTLQTIGGTAAFTATVGADTINTTATVGLVDFQDDGTFTVAGSFGGPVRLSKAGSAQVLSFSPGNATFSALTTLTTTQAVSITGATLNWNTAASELRVGNGGVTLTGNVDFSNGQLTGYVGSDPTIEFVSGAAVSFGTFTPNGDPLRFSGTGATAWTTNGQTMAAVTVAKASGTLSLSGQTLTSAAVSVQSALSTSGTSAVPTLWTVSSGGFALSAGTISWSDSRLVLAGGNLAVSGGALALSTTVASGAGGIRGVVFTGTGQTITNTGTIQLVSTVATSPVHLLGGTGTTWPSGVLTWAGGDLALGSVTLAGPLTQPASAVLYLQDSAVALGSTTWAGIVDFREYPTLAVSHNLEVSGDLTFSAAVVRGHTIGAGSTMNLTNSGSVTLTGAAVPVTAPAASNNTFHHLTLAGVGTVVLASDLVLTGNFTQTAGTFNADGPASSRKLLVQGNLSLGGAITAATNRLSLIWAGAGNRTVTASTTFPQVDLYLAGDLGLATPRVFTQLSDLTFYRMVALSGRWLTNSFDLTLIEDFAAYGTGYASSDDPERTVTRGAANGLLGYPYWLPAVRSGFYSFLSATQLSNLPADLLVSDDRAAAFVFTAGDTLTAGRNFYNHGASMTSAGVWSLSLPAKFTAVLPGDPAVPTEWFGRPFAVALNSSAAKQGTVSGSSASRPVAAAWSLSAGGQLTNGAGNTNWDFLAPTIASARTRFDDLVEIEFSEPVLNSRSQLLKAVGQTLAVDNLRFGVAGTENAQSIVQFEDGDGVARATGAAGEYGTSTFPTSDGLRWVGFRSSATWNTDAYGSSAGATPPGSGTNRSGVNQGLVPDITVEKGRIFDAAGNPLRNYGTNTSALFTATLDRARPVLYQVISGQAAKHFPPTTPQDGHNYWRLLWSEAVNLAGHPALGANASVGTPPNAAASVAANPAASAGNAVATETTFGDSYTDVSSWPGVVRVPGLFRYSGTLYRSTRTVGGASPQTTQTDAAKTSNSLARTSARDLYIYLTAGSTGTGTSQYWDGFWWGATEPAGAVYTVPPAYTSSVLDLAGNPVETSNVSWPTVGTDPKVSFTITAFGGATGPTWELDAPVFAPFNATGADGTSYEVVPLDTNSNDKVDSVQFHVLANQVLSSQAWSSDTGHLAANRTNVLFYGVRDSSLTEFEKGFTLSIDGSTYGAAASINLGMDDTAPYLDNSAVDNTLFNGGPLPLTGFAVSDDGYFTLLLNESNVPDTWKPGVTFTVKYNPFLSMATNLAGRLVEPPVNASTGFKAVDRTTPYIALSLSGKDLKRVYVQFSRKVAAVDPSSDAGYKNILKLVDSSGAAATTNSVSSVTFINGTSSSFQELFLNLAKPLTAQDALSLRLMAGSLGAIGAAPNYLDAAASVPVTTIGLNIVAPVWASDGSGAETNRAGTDHVVHDFSGKEYLTARDIELQVKIFGGASLTALPLRLFYDFNVDSSLVAGDHDVWLPSGLYTFVSPKVVPTDGDTAARYLDPTKKNAGGDLRNFVVPGNDSEMDNGSTLEFLFQLGSLYVVRSVDPTDPRQIAPWRVPLKGIKTQKNGVTILHNVIDPTQGEKTQILYTMARSGVISAQVFALDGSLVKVLHRGRQAAGDYSLYWDGKNDSGSVVARGVYFIRVVAPDVDETRNVMVIK